MRRDRKRCCARSELARSAPRIAPDLDSDPKVVRVELQAREAEWELSPGCGVRSATFDGSVPGPTLQARVGQTLIVRLENRLRDRLAIHWHGLPVSAHLDGASEVGLRGIAPKDAFEYRFQVRQPGTFWYHPHVPGPHQSEQGLYGALIFRDHDEPALDGEKLLLLDEVRFDRAGWPPHRSFHVPVVNGRAQPRLFMSAGTIERWRLVNVSSSRCMHLSLGGIPFRILGTDGGLLAHAVEARDVLLMPGNRVELAVGPLAEGERVPIECLAWGRDRAALFATVRVGPARKSHARIPAALKAIERLVPAGAAAAVNQTVRLGAVRTRPKRRTHLLDHLDPVRVGALQIWDVLNEADTDQCFHLHGFFFQVLEVNGEEPAFLSWEDTYNVPARGRVRIAWLPEDKPGSWILHLHVLGGEAGLPAHFDVVRPDEEPRRAPYVYVRSGRP